MNVGTELIYTCGFSLGRKENIFYMLFNSKIAV